MGGYGASVAKVRVSVRVDRERLQLRWTLSGQQTVFSLGLGDSLGNMDIAVRKVRLIEDDLLFGGYDPTLEKYRVGDRLSPKKVTLLEVWESYLAGHVVLTARV